MSTKCSKWLRWSRTIEEQLIAAMQSRLIYREIGAIVRQNRDLPQQSLVYGWMTMTYVDSVIMAIRRQIKVTPQAISLARLMRDMQANPTEIRRERWIAEGWGDPHHRIGAWAWEQRAGNGALHLDASRIASDADALGRAVATVERWADKRLAHFDRGGAPVPPTYRELDDGPDLLEKMYSRYAGFLIRNMPVTLTPSIAYNWKEVFLHPWLNAHEQPG